MLPNNDPHPLPYAVALCNIAFEVFSELLYILCLKFALLLLSDWLQTPYSRSASCLTSYLWYLCWYLDTTRPKDFFPPGLPSPFSLDAFYTPPLSSAFPMGQCLPMQRCGVSTNILSPRTHHFLSSTFVLGLGETGRCCRSNTMAGALSFYPLTLTYVSFSSNLELHPSSMPGIVFVV